MSRGAELSTRPFTYDRSDFRALAVLARPRVYPWLYRIAWVLFAMAFLLILICYLAGSYENLIFVPFLGILLAIYLLLHRFGSDITAKIFERVGRRDGILKEQVLTVADDCFRAESERGKTEVRWSAIPRIHRDDDRLFVYSTRRLAFIIPERAFSTREEFEAFADAAWERWRAHHRL
jgi:hypothetical protein